MKDTNNKKTKVKLNSTGIDSAMPEKEVNNNLVVEKLAKTVIENLTIERLNEKIIEITEIIQTKFPELSKFLDDKPFSALNSDIQDATFQDLKVYYLSLEEILEKYDRGISK